MNRVELVGRLTRDPELRHTTSGAATCNLTVAINRLPDRDGNVTADFIPVVTWNKQAENVARYLAKGRLVAVEGRIQTRNYEDKDGKRVYVTEVVASNVQFLESRNSSNNNNGGFDNNNNYSQPMPDYNDREVSNQATVESVDLDNDPFASFGETIDVSDNDLPF